MNLDVLRFETDQRAAAQQMLQREFWIASDALALVPQYVFYAEYQMSQAENINRLLT